MARVTFTPNLQRYVDTRELVVCGNNVGEVLGAVFVEVALLRGYLLDDQGALRKHVNIFVDNEAINDRTGLLDRVTETSEVFIVQALSGG